ncbi:hypothetical protein ACHAWF_006979 [Thalassiosira exigua]
MNTRASAFALLYARLLSYGRGVQSVMVGDEVCITGYVMDRFCIDLGYLLDNSDVVTLEHPEEHSYHCLLDVDLCYESGYVVLTEKDPETGLHGIGYRLEETDTVLQVGRAAGRYDYCETCTGGDSSPEYGFRATITGTVKDMGDGSDGVPGAPTLEGITVQDESIECPEPVSIFDEQTPAPSDDPTKAPVPAPTPAPSDLPTHAPVTAPTPAPSDVITPAPTTPNTEPTLTPSQDQTTPVPSDPPSTDAPRMESTLAPTSNTLQVGDEVCITNYVMDQFCINLGHFLDNDSVMTLESPEQHSFHCLLDVPRCRDSGYVVLTDKDSETGMHCLGYRLDDTEAVVAAGSAAGQQGYCEVCTGDESKPEYGFRATVKGTVKELGDGSDGITGTPVLENITVIDESVEQCETTVANPVCMAIAPEDVVSEPPGVSPATDSSKNCFEEFCDYALEAEKYNLRYMINVPADTTESECEGCTITMEVTYDGEAWVGIGFSRDGQMVGSEAVLGLPSESSVLKYNMASKSSSGVQPMPQEQQTLADTSIEVKDGKTVMRFTKIMKEEGEIEIGTGDNTFLWAYGSGNALGYHAQRKSFELSLSSQTVEATIQVGDEVCITNYPMPQEQQTLADTSIEVKDDKTVMRFTKTMKEEGEIEITTKDNIFLWAYGSGNALGIHASRQSFELNLSSGASEAIAVPNKAAWLAHGIMAFIAWGVFAPFAVQSSLLRDLLPSGPLWFQLHRGFNSMAFALFVAVFAIAVSFTSKEGGTHFINSHQKMGLAMFIMASAQVAGGIFRPHLPAPDSVEEKTSVRKAWEVGHRVMGVTLLACGFWQMSSGVDLYSIKYSVDEDKLMIAYWVWIGIMTAVIVVGGGYFKFKNASSNSLNGGATSGGDVP